MNKEEIIEYCLTLENTFKDCPFPDDFESVTMKHCKNKKWFALIMNVNNKLYLNVKTDPNYSDILRNTYDYIIPAYHMNKEHWNTIIVDEKVDKTLVKEMIEQSYENQLNEQKKQVEYFKNLYEEEKSERIRTNAQYQTYLLGTAEDNKRHWWQFWNKTNKERDN